jgi:hypothetical protein
VVGWLRRQHDSCVNSHADRQRPRSPSPGALTPSSEGGAHRIGRRELGSSPVMILEGDLTNLVPNPSDGVVVEPFVGRVALGPESCGDRVGRSEQCPA